MNKMLQRALLCAVLCGGSLAMNAQSITTGTLKLRNAQPETVGITLPAAGVTGYSIVLPATIGTAGQSLTVQSAAGTTATLGWTSNDDWRLAGSSIAAGGTGASQQYLGTSNSQDLVIAANATEAIRIIGIAGASQGFIGIGTSTPRAGLDIARNVLLSNTGTATELRFAEPSASGTNYTAFKATTQAADVTYTLPDAAPASDGMVLHATSAGVLSWKANMSNTPRGLYTPTVGQYIHNIPAGYDISGSVIPMVSMMNPAGTTISASVTAIDAATDTFTVETSVPLGAADRIAWILLAPF
ncbi:MAG: hypothetical protein FJ211_05345 [Ignavibacteria bacterium]|nr:hypothetical protein [Ignavibacteria bacterium]